MGISRPPSSRRNSHKAEYRYREFADHSGSVLRRTSCPLGALLSPPLHIAWDNNSQSNSAARFRNQRWSRNPMGSGFINSRSIEVTARIRPVEISSADRSIASRSPTFDPAPDTQCSKQFRLSPESPRDFEPRSYAPSVATRAPRRAMQNPS